MPETLVKVENVSKKFCRDLKTSLWYGIKDLATEITAGIRKPELRAKEFWALQDVNFELKRGESLGIIGRNGAGKSTLLKILTGLIKPDTGRVVMRGRVQSLIELGAGFNPVLTGRENIYINAAVLGIPKRTIDKKLDEIIDFAELEGFIDAPVMTYSSGMRIRLGFAVAVNVNPDILIIDEVLAVGDIAFQNKAMKKMAETRENAGVVIFVSHNMPAVRNVCNTGLFLAPGIKPSKKDIVDTISDYYRMNAQSTQKDVVSFGELTVKSWYLTGGRKSVSNGEQIEIIYEIMAGKDYGDLDITTAIANGDKLNIIGFNSTERSMKTGNLKKGLNKIKVSYGKCNLVNGHYYPHLAVRSRRTGETFLRIDSAKPLCVEGSGVGYGILDGDFNIEFFGGEN